jgi:hypothetical protein
MTEQKEVRIPFSDLSSMVIECQVAPRFVLILLKTRRPTRTGIAICFPAPVCTRRVDDNLRLGFAPFIEWRNRVIASKKEIYVRLRDSN